MENNSNYIIPYLSGTLSPEEKKSVESLLESDPSFKKEMEEAGIVYNAIENLKFQKTIDEEKNWKQLSFKISSLRFREKLFRFCQSAAAILFIPLILASSYAYYRMNLPKPEEMIEQVSARGLVSSITLSDGSKVWLNSGSKLTYPREFKGDIRNVKLEGEGYFIVTADKKHRFDVELIDGKKVSAYGTEFNISSFYGNEQVEVVLAKGHVDVLSRDNKAYDMEPGFHLVLEGEKPLYERTNVYVQTAWKDGKMVFRRAGMSEIVRKLSLHFNVDIELKDQEINNYELNATFTTESLPQILRLIEKSTPIKWTIEDPQIQSDLSYTKQKVIIQSLKKI